MTKRNAWTLGLGLFLPIAVGCSASGDGSQVGGGSSSTGSPSSPSGTIDDPAGGGIIVDETSSTRPAGIGTVGDCGGDSYQGEPGRLDMYIMMDRSGSMIFPFDLWTPIGSALGTFVERPEAAGIGVGIQFFENQGGSCAAADYAIPAAPIALLPQNGPAIQQAIVSNGPLFGGTPTMPALQGAIQHARDWASQTGTKTIVVLATDGNPEECGSDVSNVSAAAADGLNGAPSIPTYVIGIGNISALNQIAVAGGTGQAFIVPADPALASQQFLDAMNAIRGAALPCDYAIPEEAVDPGLVNVEFTPGGAAPELVPNVLDASGCGAGGWHYDDPAAPGRIVACPESCARFNGGGVASVNVIVGCETVTLR